MKKAFCVILAMIMLITLTSCSTININSPSDTPAIPLATPTEPTEIESEPANIPTEPIATEPVVTEPAPDPSTLSVCGIDISQYVIVYPSNNHLGEKELAELLSAYILSAFNVEIPVISDENDVSEHEILLGFTNDSHFTTSIRSKSEEFEKYRVDTYHSTIITVDGYLLVLGSNENTLNAGVDKLISEITPIEQGSDLEVNFSDDSTIINASIFSGEAIRVMSYNVYTNNPNRYRGLQLMNNINSFAPDVLGVQELNPTWIKLFKSYTNLFDVYDMVGKPRLEEKDPSNGNEYSAIFYRKDKFNLIESNTYWLSDTPDQISKFDDTEYYRIMTYAVLECKSDNKRFIHVNTHLATEKGPRQQQIAVLLELAGGLLEKYGDIPMYFTGDFNMTSSDQGYTTMIAWGNEDSRTLSGTGNQEATCGKSIIDYCFITNGTFHVTDFDVGYGLEGSDHYPVYVELYIK